MTDFQFWSDEGWYPAPHWANYFVKLGAAIAEGTKPGSDRLVVALALPTRAYAGALIAASFVLSTFTSPHPEQYFSWIASLPPGTSLRRRKGEKWQPAILDSVKQQYGNNYIVIQTTVRGSKGSGPVTEWVPKHDILSLHVDKTADAKLPGTNPRFSSLDTPKTFLKPCLDGGGSPLDYVMATAYDCAIIGQLNRLRYEFNCTPIGVTTEGGISEGRLQDLARVKRFTSRGEGYRTRIFPITVGTSIPHYYDHGTAPRLAIFDGARGFLRWRFRFSTSHWIVLLERTEIDFLSGVQYVIAECDFRCQEQLMEITPPPGIEILAYRRCW